MEDFNFFTQKDRQDISYGACVGATTLVGAGVGRFLGLYGLLAGAAAGIAYGLVACRALSPAIEDKLFSANARFTEPELLQVLRALNQHAGVATKSDGMYLLTAVQHSASAQGLNRATPPRTCMPMRVAAAQMLASKRT